MFNIFYLITQHYKFCITKRNIKLKLKIDCKYKLESTFLDLEYDCEILSLRNYLRSYA